MRLKITCSISACTTMLSFVLSPLGQLRHIVPNLEIQTIQFGSKRESGCTPSSLALVLDDPYFDFANNQKEIVKTYLFDHCPTIHAQENTTPQPPVHPALQLLDLYKHSLSQPLPQPLSHLSNFTGDIFKTTTGYCRSYNNLIRQIVKEQGEKQHIKSDKTRFHVLRGWQGQRGWKPVMLPSFFPRKYGEPMLKEAKERLLERLKRIDGIESAH